MNKNTKSFCLICDKKFTVKPNTQGKYCRYKCYWESLKGKRVSMKTEFKNGQKPWNTGRTKDFICKTCEVSFKRKSHGVSIYCSEECKKNGDWGKEIGKWNKGRKAWNKGKSNTWSNGEKSNFWKGGITPINKALRESLEYEDWRRKVFERDSYTCQGCGKIGGWLEADHLKPSSLYPELRFEIDNGRTFCKPCHKKFGWELFREGNPKKRINNISRKEILD